MSECDNWIVPFNHLGFIITDVLKNVEHLSRIDIENLLTKKSVFGLGC